MKLRNMRMRYATHFKDGDEGDGGGNSSGDKSDGWRDGFGEDFREHKGLADFKDLDGLAKAYLDTKADVGRSLRLPGPDADADAITAFNTSLMQKVPGLTAIPGEGADDKVRDEFFRQLGRPDEASGYDMPDAGGSLKEGLSNLRDIAHKSGMSKDQYKAIATSLVESHKAASDAGITEIADGYDNLKIDWGNSMKSRTKAILALAKATNAPEAMQEAIKNQTLDAGSMKWLDGVVESLSGEGSQLQFQGSQNAADRVSPTEANDQIEELMNKPEYWDEASPLQKGLIDKVVKLQKVALS